MGLKVEEALHMVGGAGATSYAANSRLQEKAILKTKTVLRNAMEEIYREVLPQRLVVADLGCSSGPNTLLVVSQLLRILGELSQRPEQKQLPEVQFFLNDLPGNDFNTIFRSLGRFEKKVEEEIERDDVGRVLIPHYIMGVPGSFYGRLFPSRSVHFFHSSYCLMWLSQVPQGIEHLNERNIYFTATSPPGVEKAYRAQFQRDFSAFLKSRHQELTAGGRMVLTFLGRKENQHISHGDLSSLYQLLGEALSSMVSEGMISEDKVNSFNVPIYGSSMEEVRSIISSQGLFDLQESLVFESSWDPFYVDEDDDEHYAYAEEEVKSSNSQNAKNVVDTVRAAVEPLIAHQFGEDILDDLFSRYEKNVSRHLLKGKANYTVLVIVLKKKKKGEA